MLEEIAGLKQRWIELYPQFPEIRDEMVSRVARWEWVNGAHYATQHYYVQQVIKGEPLMKLPVENATQHAGDFHYGYDAEGKLVISHLNGEAWENLYSFSDDLIETTAYHAAHPVLRGLTHVFHTGDRPAHTLKFFLQGHLSEFIGTAEDIWNGALERDHNLVADREDYTYAGESLVRIRTKHWEHGWHHSEPDKVVESEHKFDYLPSGELERITWRGITYGNSGLMYRRLLPGETLQSLTHDVESKLIEAIPRIIQQANFTEPLYCIQLGYVDGRFFPPQIKPGLESYRQQYLATDGEEYGKWRVWVTVASYENDTDPTLPIEDTSILEASEKLQLEIWSSLKMAGYRYGAKTLYRIAQCLNQLDWSAYAPVTPDFIVFAYDEEDLAKALRLSGATPEQMAGWRKRGLL
jgi:hypothetical protein